MFATLISPRIGIQKGDFLGSGIPYWPLEVATLASFLRNRGDTVRVIDLFGSDPLSLEDRGDYFLQGTPYSKGVTAEQLAGSDVVIVYAISYMSHQDILPLVAHLRALLPGTPIAVLENSQAVTAYALPHLATSFFERGASALLCGEVYWNWPDIERFMLRGGDAPPNVVKPGDPDGIIVTRQFNKTPSFPIPAWDLFNLGNYWKLPYSHGPKTKRFLPIMTSRGCPYPCDFCVVPETNDRMWRGRPAAEVVDEILSLRDRFGVRDFQIEDLNPTVKGKRTEEICRLLVERRAGVQFYIVSGTKAETVRIESVPLMAEAGCRYISISPESGSKKVMEAVGKPFDYEHGAELVKRCRENGIRTQACFIVGHPAEQEDDHQKSVEYLRRLVRSGLDEVAVFVVAPFAGSQLFQQQKIDIQRSDAYVSFSPKGRSNYRDLERRRGELIRIFFIEKLKRGPDLWMQGLRAVFGTPATKMENLPWRIVFVYVLFFKHFLKRTFGGGAAGTTPGVR